MKTKNLLELGALLKEEREKKGESLELVAQKLFIKSKYISIIESGNIKELSLEQAYLRGFINSYLKYLGLNINYDIDNEIKEVKEKKKPRKETQVPVDIIPPKEEASIGMILLFSILLLGLVYLLWNKQTYFDLNNLGTIIDNNEKSSRDMYGN